MPEMTHICLYMCLTQGAHLVSPGSCLPEYLLQLWMAFAELIQAVLLLLRLCNKIIQLQMICVQSFQSFLNVLSQSDIALLLLNGCSFDLHLSLRNDSNVKGLTHVATHHAGGLTNAARHEDDNSA